MTEKFFLAVTVLALLLLFWRGARYIRKGEASSFRPSSGPWPRAAVIVPVAGAYPELMENLRSRLTQDYPRYEVVFATAGEADPATRIIRALLPNYPQASLVLCGSATTCSQKNHNLLKGLETIAPEVEILVFSDANQTTPAHWLKALVQPLVRDGTAVSSSFHHVIPQDSRLPTLGRGIAVLLIYLGKGIAGWDQPWGGSTAIQRQVFEDLQMARLWSRTVVDDVTLARELQQHRIKMAAAPGGVLATPARETMASWANWFIRQLIYLKFYFYFPWLMLGAGIFSLLILVVFSLSQILLALSGDTTWSSTASASFLIIITAVVFFLRRLHPHPGPPLAYVPAIFLTLGMAAWCHARTWFTWNISWRNLVYTVDKEGLVTEIQRL